jgi:hypothetical protein
MAFGGPGVIFVGDAGLKNQFLFVGSLAGRIAPPNPPNADTGQLVTGPAANANQFEIPTGWGRGRGNWRQADLFHLTVAFINSAADAVPVGGANTGPDVYLVSVAVAGNNLLFTFHNRGVGPTDACSIKLIYEHSMVR